MEGEEQKVAMDYEAKSRIVKECLQDPERRLHLNASMAATIREEVYAHSLARKLLLPRLIAKGHSPVFAENSDGPIVMVNLVQKEQRVLRCRAFRDSLREEEVITSVRDIDFVVMRGEAIRPASFPISNVCTLRWPDLNGNAYSMVERARTRLKVVLATDETKVMLRALAWVCRKFGQWIWAPRAETCVEMLRRAIERVGPDKNPVVLTSMNTMMQIRGLQSPDLGPKDVIQPIIAIRMVRVDERDYPVYFDAAIPDHRIYVVPSGESLGEMPIFTAPDVMDYDKPERLIKGWLCYQDQGMVFVNVKLTNTIYVGFRGLLDLLFGGFRKASS